MVYPARKHIYDDLTEATKAAQAAQLAGGVWRMRLGNNLWIIGDKLAENADRDRQVRRENHSEKKSAYEPNRSDSFLFRSLMLAPWYLNMLKNALGEDALKALILKLHSSNRRDRLEAERRMGLTQEPAKNKKEKEENDDVAATIPAPSFGFAFFAGVASMEARFITVIAPAILLAKNGWRNFSVAFVSAVKKAVDNRGFRRNLRTAELGAATSVAAISTPHPVSNILAI